MATSTLPLILLLLGFLLVAAVSARPCKTLFYFSATTTTTTTTYFPNHGNPNIPNSLQSQTPRHITLIFTSTTTSRFPNHHQSLNFEPVDRFSDDSGSAMTSPLKFYTSTSSSFRDRTRDMLSVVGALLFGVGCGALTGAVMYFVWALIFSSRRVDFNYTSSDDDDDDDDVTVSKKLGYVAIPKMVDDDDLKKPAPPAKEVV